VLDWTFKQRAAAFLVLGVAILALFHERIYNGLAGPFDVEARQLITMHDVPAQRFVRVLRDGRPVHYNELVWAGLIEQQVEDDDRHTTASYSELDVDGHPLIVRAVRNSSADDNPPLIGLIEMPGSELARYAPGDTIFVDGDQATYRFCALAAFVTAMVALLAGLDQLRRAYRRRAADSPPFI